MALRLKSPLGDLHLPSVRATDDPAEIGPVDMVMVLVKLYDTDAAARAIAPLLGPETAVISFQNGIDARRLIGTVVGDQRMIGGIAIIPAYIQAPGIISHGGPLARLIFGEFDGRDSTRCNRLLAEFERAGVEAEITGEIDVAIWEKFLQLSALSATTTLTRLPIGALRADPETFELYERAVAETHAVGRILCPDLSGDSVARTIEMARALPDTMRASMLGDLEHGKRLELDYLSGTIARLGAELGVPVPTHDLVARALRPYRDGPPVPPD